MMKEVDVLGFAWSLNMPTLSSLAAELISQASEIRQPDEVAHRSPQGYRRESRPAVQEEEGQSPFLPGQARRPRTCYRCHKHHRQRHRDTDRARDLHRGGRGLLDRLHRQGRRSGRVHEVVEGLYGRDQAQRMGGCTSRRRRWRA